MKTILCCGSAGFIGSNLVRRLIHSKLNYKIISVDKLGYPEAASNVYYGKAHKFYLGDITNQDFINNIFKIEKPDYIINLAAESHVDLSIESATPFVQSNVLGTQVLINACLKFGIEKFLLVSTDEVYGQLKDGDLPWTEGSVPNPRNPYAASKYASEVMLQAANITHNLPIAITRCSNNFGPRQRPINLIPKTIKNALANEKIPVYGNGMQSRSWLFVDNHIDAIMLVLEKGQDTIYNIDLQAELTNLELVNKILGIMKASADLISFVPNRKAHDWRYACNSDKLLALGWKPEFKFKESLENTVNWYVSNQWFLNIKN